MWLEELKEKRMLYGISQTSLAVQAGISREYLNRIENGNCPITEDMKVKITEALEKMNPEAPLTMLIDYVRIRFPSMDIKYVIEKLLRIKMQYMGHEDYAWYSYTEHYRIGDIIVMTSMDEKKGILLELKGKGCRQFESYLSAQERGWYDFFVECLKENAVFKRIDLAINDTVGILNIPELIEKCKNEECISVFRSFKDYSSGELVRRHEQHKAEMGNTLYIGSLKSDIYFCIYEKDYEQYIKNDIPLEESEIKNRFEIRLKEDRAFHAAYDLISYRDAERTAFSIINRYMRIVDKDENKRRSEWKTNRKWKRFIGKDRKKLKLTTKPEPYTIERTLNWLARQVAPTLKLVKQLDYLNNTEIISDMLDNAKFTERHKKLLEQQVTSIEDMIIK